MRRGHLLLFVFVGLPFGLGFANPALAQSPAVPSTQTPILNWNKTPSFNFSGKNLFGKPAMRQDAVCYAMRTYRVTQVASDSDVVEPSGFTTCQPSSTYSVKNAVQPLRSPSR